ncbi:hypothetical protein Tco_0282824 [Tanacetum coccineum]
MEQEVILFYNGLGISTQQILDSRGAIPLKTAADAKVAIQEMAEYSQKWHNGTSRSRSTETSDRLTSIQAQLNNLGREIKKVNEKVYAAQVEYEQCKGPYYTKDCPLKEEGKTLEEAYYTQFGGPFQGGGYKAASPGFYQRNDENPSYQERRQSMEDTERGLESLPSSTETNPRDQVKSISTTIEADSYPICRIGSSQYAKGSYGPQFSKAYSEASHINNSIPRKEKDPGSFTLPCFINNVCFDNALLDLGASFHNSIMKEKLEYKGNNVVGALMNIPIFVGTFSVMTDFAVLENMDAYRDEGMGDVIFGEPFLREVGIKTRRFEGMITIYNGDDEVTYQMVRSHPRFKRHTNKKCNKIPPLLRVSEEDKMNGISHSYQKLKGFYKGVLNLGPDYIRDAKMEEWLTRGHISVHDME